MSSPRPRIVPQCRYDHGPLLRVDNAGKTPEWGIMAPGHPFGAEIPGFLLSLFVCRTCGYSEFFDLDPELTYEQQQEQKKK